MPSIRCWSIILCQFSSEELLRRDRQVPFLHAQGADMSVLPGGSICFALHAYVESGIERLSWWLLRFN